MEPDIFISKHFKAALRIHEQCEKMNLPVDMARLITYIHVRIFNCGNSTDQEIDHENITQVIDIMLGRRKTSFMHKKNVDIPNKINELDAKLRDNYGMEYRLYSEFDNRSRFHKDEEFRSKILQIYNNLILPALIEESSVN